MKTYRVFAKVYYDVYVDVKAKDFEQALDKAGVLDGGDYKELEMSGGFDITHIQDKTTGEEKAII